MKNYEVEVAKFFKKLENKVPIGPVIGKVIKPLPNLEVSILNGEVVLDSKNLYVCEKLFDDYTREFESFDSSISLEAQTELELAGVTGQATENPLGHSHDIKLTDIDYTSKGTIMFTDTLKEDDLLMLVPTVSEQIWFVIDKVRKV